jgi:hypothetical protein
MTISESDLVITPYAAALPTALSLKREATCSYFGPCFSLPSLPNALKAWAASTVDGDLINPLKAFLEQVHSFLSEHARGKDHYWIDVRATQIHDQWNIPRWHTDGNFFYRPNDGQWKLATCLLGPGTLFLIDGVNGRKVETEQREIVLDAMDKQELVDKVDGHGFEAHKRIQDMVRKTLADMFAEWEIVQPRNDEMAFFRVGSVTPAVHSEPKSVGDRIFVSVLPGTEAELRELVKNWRRNWGDQECQ